MYQIFKLLHHELAHRMAKVQEINPGAVRSPGCVVLKKLEGFFWADNAVERF